jgi:hypothetical protein
VITAIVSRFKSWLRAWLFPDVSFGSLPSSLTEVIADLVERARAGDQNAIAMICEIRDNANRGESRAKESAREIEQYIKKHPVTDMGCDQLVRETTAAFGADPYEKVLIEKVKPLAERNLKKAIVTVANGPSLLRGYRELIETFAENLSDNERDAFKLGAAQTSIALQAMRNFSHECQHALILGYVLGKARRIQAVRLPGVPIAVQSAIAAKELE